MSVAFLSMCSGGIVGAFDAIVAFEHLPKAKRGQPGERSFEEDRIIIEVVVAIYGIAYAVGRLIYKYNGQIADLAALEKWSRWHMNVLHLLGSIFLIVSGWQALWNEHYLRPSLFVGLFLGLFAWLDAKKRLQKMRARITDHNTSEHL